MYMLVTWQTVALTKVQLHVTAFSLPFTWTEDVQLRSPLHGSTLKSQSFFPSVSAISLRASTIKPVRKKISYKSCVYNHLHNTTI